jgi:L-aminopeptidase/D-esterase-like protein
VAAAVAVNAAGSAVDPVTGRLYADRRHLLATPTEQERDALSRLNGTSETNFASETSPPSETSHPSETIATTIGVVITDARLTKAQANKVAAVGHDGMARSFNPIHTMLDGDTVFCLASGHQDLPARDTRAAVSAFNQLISGAADVFADACLDAVVSASSYGRWPSYAALAPSAVAGRRS